jgi:hypothetical protein
VEPIGASDGCTMPDRCDAAMVAGVDADRIIEILQQRVSESSIRANVSSLRGRQSPRLSAVSGVGGSMGPNRHMTESVTVTSAQRV